jgi:thiol:disulfide interchange protein DsbD
MNPINKLFLITLLILVPLTSALSYSDEKPPKEQVFTSVNFYQNGSKKFVAISYKHHPHWHTYWKNPGDAGLAPKAIFKQADQVKKLEMTEWPAPIRFISPGNILSYGYKDDFTLFHIIPNGLAGKINLELQWLACKNICIPGTATYELDLKSDGLSSNTKNRFEVTTATLAERFAATPKTIQVPKNVSLRLVKSSEENKMILSYQIKTQGQLNKKSNIMTPFPNVLLDFSGEEVLDSTSGNFVAQIPIEWDGEYSEPPVPFPTGAKFKEPIKVKLLYRSPADDSVSVIEKEFHSFDKVSFIAASTSNSNTGGSSTPLATNAATTTSSSLLIYLLMAFIGGLILNVMPCVLPVISIKLFGLLQHSHDSKKKIFKHNMAYTVGVLFTFAVLAVIVVAIKSTGESIGWGFQLQSPKFVTAMILVIFLMSLNMFGLFEFSTPGGRHLGSVKLREGLTGDFFGGVLATILSTPCSAPFLGTALTFAFSSPSYVIFAIFGAIGIGLSFPFILTAFFPKMISFLPKPGMWMEGVKKFLGVTLIITVLWLLDVLNAQVDSSLYGLKINVALTFIFFFFYMKKNITKNKFFSYSMLLIPLFVFGQFFYGTVSLGEQSGVSLGKNNLNWEKWSEERMVEAKDKGELLFIDFTAKWCLTCKVNEKLVLETDSFKELVEKKDLKLLLGDWTKRDPIIGKWLAKNGAVGVPAYFIQKKNGELINLGETITLKKIESYL